MKKVKNILLKIFKNNIIIFTIYLMIIEVLFKLLTNTFAWNYTLLRIFISSSIISVILNIGISLIKNKYIKKYNLDDEEIIKLINERNEFKDNKKYEEADIIRERLTDMGVVIKDSSLGTTWDIIIK